jgi:hypothetical protein
MSTERLFETALGVGQPWYVKAVRFEEADRTFTLAVDFRPGSGFGVAGAEGEHAVQDMVGKRYRHLNFFQHDEREGRGADAVGALAEERRALGVGLGVPVAATRDSGAQAGQRRPPSSPAVVHERAALEG